MKMPSTGDPSERTAADLEDVRVISSHLDARTILVSAAAQVPVDISESVPAGGPLAAFVARGSGLLHVGAPIEESLGRAPGILGGSGVAGLAVPAGALRPC